MFKDKNKQTQSKAKVKYEKENVVEKTEEEVNEEDISEPGITEKDIRTVSITLDFYENIIPMYPTADVQAKCKYQDKILGDTSMIPVTDDSKLTVNESFCFKVNVNSQKDTDYLISTPAQITISQHTATCDPNLYEQLHKCDDLKVASSVKSFESVVSLYEAFTGDTVDRDILDAAVKKSKSMTKKGEKKQDKKSKDKSSRGSKISKASKTTSARKKQKRVSDEATSLGSVSVAQGSGSVTYGMCVIDFLPLFYGKLSYTETLLINPVEIFTDERMTTYKMCPKITITVSIDKKMCFNDPIILNVTLESIYNIPSIMGPNMDYKVCAMLPMENSVQEPMLFTNPTYTKKTQDNVMKCWPNIKKIGANANTTKYKISQDHIKNTTEIDDVESVIKEDGPRLQFNVLKRNLLLKRGMEAFCHQVHKYHKILLEIYMCAKEKSRVNTKSMECLLDGRSSVATVKSSRSKSENLARQKNYLHLMATVDASVLLYPGVPKVRIACPLMTYSEEEALKNTGATESYLLPKPKVDVIGEVSEGRLSKAEKRSEQSKKPDKTSSKTSKSSVKGVKKTSEAKDKADLKQVLKQKTQPPPESDPSVSVYNEYGQQTFLIIEIELSESIFAKRNIEDLNFQLQELLQEQRHKSTKIVLTHRLTKDYYREVLNQITRDIYDRYKYFLSIRELNTTIAEKDFIKYLESEGAYQTYLSSIKESISLLTATKFRIDEHDKKNSKMYQNFIGEVYVYLISEMNDTLNRFICSGLEPVIAPKPKSDDRLFFHAKEAAALGKTELADRYFLERICYDENGNADTWFDYAIFNLEIKQPETAYECVLEALAKKPNHRYSLLLLGAMLVNKEQKDEAETCFLNLLVHEPRWVEGWVTLYLFYDKINRQDGMDMAMEMVKKYLDDERITRDYFNEYDDLLWTYKMCPKTIFFRTAVLLLKMRLFEWVEMALVQELQQQFGHAYYLLSAVCMYKGQYEAALQHIQQTKAYCGCDYAVCSLSGHCLFALNRQQEAKEDYFHALEAIDRPDDIHMVYINLAQILETLGDHQEARQLILLACKYTPTHYTWFKAGQLYLKENDLLSAEECFSEANFSDNRCPEYWGYLTIINLQLNRTSEAELCYSQAIQNNLNEAMHERIRKEFKKFNSTTHK